MYLLSRPHQGRGTAQLLFRVHVGFVVDQDLDRVHVAVARREHDRRLLIRIALIYIRPGGEQFPDHGSAAVDAGQD
jgi:hypothetical protein